MKRYFWLMLVSLCFATAPMMAQSTDHVEVGVFADYSRLSQSPVKNLVGLGGRAAIGLRPHVQLEAEMAYDFKRSFTSTFTNGTSTELVNTKLRTLHGLFGPKLQTGSGPFRLYVTGKTGFVNFSVSNQGATAGFTSALGGVATGATKFAVYPGVGVEAFSRYIGLRAEIGDEIYFDHGSHNNVRVTFGPQIRF